MTWLDEYLKVVDTTSNVSAVSRGNASPVNSEIVPSSLPPTTVGCSTPISSTPLSTEPAPKRTRKEANVTALDEQFLSSMDKLVNAIGNASESPRDASDNFATMIGAQHRSLNTDQQKYFALKCQNAYVEALQFQAAVDGSIHDPPQ